MLKVVVYVIRHVPILKWNTWKKHLRIRIWLSYNKNSWLLESLQKTHFTISTYLPKTKTAAQIIAVSPSIKLRARRIFIIYCATPQMIAKSTRLNTFVRSPQRKIKIIIALEAFALLGSFSHRDSHLMVLRSEWPGRERIAWSTSVTRTGNHINQGRVRRETPFDTSGAQNHPQSARSRPIIEKRRRVGVWAFPPVHYCLMTWQIMVECVCVLDSIVCRYRTTYIFFRFLSLLHKLACVLCSPFPSGNIASIGYIHFCSNTSQALGIVAFLWPFSRCLFHLNNPSITAEIFNMLCGYPDQMYLQCRNEQTSCNIHVRISKDEQRVPFG